MIAIFNIHAQTETLKVWIEDAKITADGNSITKLKVFENDMADYTAFNMSIIVPKGVTVAKVNQGRDYAYDIQLSARGTSSHSISCNMLDDGRTIKIIATSSNNDNFYNDDIDGNPLDEIFTIGLMVDSSIANGNYDIRIDDCKFVMKEDAVASEPYNDMISTLTIEGGKDSHTIDYILEDSGCDTLILPFDSEIPDGLTVYRCTSISNESVSLETQSYIPANMPLIVLGNPGTYTFTGIPIHDKDSYNDGDFIGVYSSRDITNGYILKNTNGVCAFCAVNSDVPVKIPTFRCYLQGDYETSEIKLDLSSLTIDRTIIDNLSNQGFYDLNGRYVNNPQEFGIYVKKGKKQLKR